MIKRLLTLLLAAVMVVSAAGCSTNSADLSSSEKPSSKPSSSYDDSFPTDSELTGSNDSSDSPSYNQDIGGVRGDYESEDTDSSQDMGDSGEYSLWGNPVKYTIIIPAKNKSYEKYAKQIQEYFSSICSVSIPIKTDATAAGEFEILIGKTNRPESNQNIKVSDYEISVKNSKLVFDASHDVLMNLAIDRFLSNSPRNDAQATVKRSTDFKDTVLGNYHYVWGDEFEGKEVDFTKWACVAKMGGTKTAEISTDKDVIEVMNGKLVLRSMLHPTSATKKFKMPTSVVTQYNMMYTYGYCEIKARMPFFTGAWPSFWTQSNTGIGERKCFDYFVEVDIFEVFGSSSGNVVSNIHKWYTDKSHTQWQKHKDTWIAPNPDTINNEYHTYGYQWTPKEMTMYVDGQKIMTYDITESYDGVEDMSGFHDPQFIIFNNHLFTEDATWKPNTITGYEHMLPGEYEIEYFRLYQKKGEGRLWTDQKVHATYPNR